MDPLLREPKVEDNYSSESSSEEESSDESLDKSVEFVMSQDIGGIASLIALNQTYLDLIGKLMLKVEKLLENNRDQQKKIRHYLGNKNDQKPPLLPIFSAIFFPPYFKDEDKMIPASNTESIAIRGRCPFNVLLTEEKPWLAINLRLLKKSVVAQLVEAKETQIIDRRDTLFEKIRSYSGVDKAEKIAQWKEELVLLKRRLDHLKSQDAEAVLKEANFEEIDWIRMSVRQFKSRRTALQLKTRWTLDFSANWNKGSWTTAEDEILKNAMEVPWQNWDLMALRLDTRRSPFMCFERFHFLVKKANAKKPWTEEEDEKLLALVGRFTIDRTVNWKRIATFMPDRNLRQCDVRYNRSLDPNMVRGRWSMDEDILLVAAVNKYGPYLWGKVAAHVPGRTETQCRDRWIDNLDYKRNIAPWSNEEDEAILIGIKAFGRSNFSSISKMIPGRNASAVKYRVRTFFRWKTVEHQQAASSTDSEVKFRKRALPKINVLERFKIVMEKSKKLAANQHGLALARRLGYGDFVAESEEQENPDYSLIKQRLVENFGQWVIGKKGGWVKLKKNPNEYGNEELEEVLRTLPSEKKEMVTQYLNEREQRRQQLEREQIETGDDESVAEDPEQAERVAELMDEVVVVEQKDIDFYKKIKAKTDAKKKEKVKDDTDEEAEAEQSDTTVDSKPKIEEGGERSKSVAPKSKAAPKRSAKRNTSKSTTSAGPSGSEDQKRVTTAKRKTISTASANDLSQLIPGPVIRATRIVTLRQSSSADPITPLQAITEQADSNVVDEPAVKNEQSVETSTIAVPPTNEDAYEISTPLPTLDLKVEEDAIQSDNEDQPRKRRRNEEPMKKPMEE